MRGINGVRMRVPTEDAEQMALFRWASLAAPVHPELELLFHIPNGGSRGKAEAVDADASTDFPADAPRLEYQSAACPQKNESRRQPTGPDLFLPVARQGMHGLFIELKRQKGSRVSKEQQTWGTALYKQGYAAHVCYGWEDAMRVILRYLEG